MPQPKRRSHEPRRTKDAEFHAPRRRSLGGDQIEGRQAVKELILARRRTVEYVWLEDSVVRKGIIAEIVDLCLARRIPLITVSRRKFEMSVRSEGNQGILARAAALREEDLTEMVNAVPNPFLLLIDGITDPHNLGAVLRSAELSGVTGVVLPQNRTSMITPTVAKAAAGAVEHLSFALVPGIPSALMSLATLGVYLVGLDVRGKTSVYNIATGDTGRIALVLGAEDKGLARLSAERCDLLVRIPQVGRLDSLNVSAAAAVALFEVSRLRSSGVEPTEKPEPVVGLEPTT